MTAALHRHRRRHAVGILLAILVAWVLPAQACMAAGMGMAAHSTCPDCPSPADHRCCHGCCAAMMTGCSASMPAVTAPHWSPDKAVPALAIRLDYDQGLQAAKAALPPPGRPPAYAPPATRNIRFCTFQE